MIFRIKNLTPDKLIFLTALSFFFCFDFAWGFSARNPQVSTPRKQSGSKRFTGYDSTRSKDSKDAVSVLYAQLDQIGDVGRINCNRNLSDAGSCSVCNCANEVAHHEPLVEKIKVNRVVFSRMKSPDYPGTLCRVVCDPAQFSWTIGSFDKNCNRRRRVGRLFKNKSLEGRNLASCIASIKAAAKYEILDNPDTIFATHYQNPEASTDRSWVQACINTAAMRRIGLHRFCSPDGLPRGPLQPISTSSIAYLDVTIPYKLSY
jgi:hypothetical protein